MLNLFWTEKLKNNMSHLIVITPKLLGGRCKDYSTYTRTLFSKLGRNSKTLVARYLRPPDVNPRHIATSG